MVIDLILWAVPPKCKRKSKGCGPNGVEKTHSSRESRCTYVTLVTGSVAVPAN
jgi:hypothetical protein